MPSLNIIGNVNLTGGKYNRTPFAARGGQVATFTSGGINYTSHTFTSSGQFELIQGETQAQILVVGGGGGGEAGGPSDDRGRGGGAGGVNYSSSFFLKKNPSGEASTWTATIGQGGGGGLNPTGVPGIPATSGSASQFIASYSYEQAFFTPGYPGGTIEQSSGNGASGAGGGLAIYGPQGNNGGTGIRSGGGGAGQVGGNGVSGNGGNGLAFTLQDGTSKYYGGGGGGGGYSNISQGGGTGGLGGGGNGGGVAGAVPGAGGAGTANTGGGGGGGNTANDAADRGFGGNGGSGIVIITYPTGG